jgi:endonuclease IV
MNNKLVNVLIGGKLYSKNYELFEPFGKIYDFIEVLIEPDFNINALVDAVSLAKKPITIHCAHQYFGFNPGNPKKFQLSKKLLDNAIVAAEKFNSLSVVVHPGFEEDGILLKDVKMSTIEFFKKCFD